MTRKEMNWNLKKLDQFLHASVNAMPAKITEEGSTINFFLYIFLTLKEHLVMPIKTPSNDFEPDLTRATCNNRALDSKQ